MAVFVVNPHPGLVVRGNIDLTARPVVRNPNGSISTVRSISFGYLVSEFAEFHLKVRLPAGLDPKRELEVLVPTVVRSKVVSDNAARRFWEQTGQHLGIFDSVAHANAYSDRLHVWQANYYRSKIKKKKSVRR